MNGAELAPGLLMAAVGLALSFSKTKRTLAFGLAAVLVSASAASLTSLEAAFSPAVLSGCWVSIVVAAGSVHLTGRLAGLATAALGLNGGAWAGLVVATTGRTADLLSVLPWALVSVPGALLVARQQGVAVKVVLSWLAAAAVLSLGLNMTPTLGYEPDHMG